MLGSTQNPAGNAFGPWNAPGVQQLPVNVGKAVQTQQPTVIELQLQTEAEMIAKMLNKLPLPTTSYTLPGGVNPSNGYPHALAAEAFCTGKGVTGMVQQPTTKTSPQLLRCGTRLPPGLRPPPGLSHCNSLTQQMVAHPGQTLDVGLFGMKAVYGISRTADEEQCSTNDDGEHDACESLLSEDDVTHLQAKRVPAAMGGMTTLMIRNVPVMYTQEMLLLEWKNEGAYDFLYLPRTGQTNLSYAFINFVSEAHAMAFKALWHKRRLAHFTSRKPLNISFADVQGLRANLMQLKKKRVRRIEMRQCQPMIIQNGRLVDLTQAIAALQN